MYSGYRLDGGSRKRLLQLVKPRYPHVLADHVTHSMRGEPAPDARHIEVLGHLHDDARGVQAAVVSVDGRLRRPDGRPYHVTISIDPSVGAKPEHANELVDQGYRKVGRPRVRLKGHSSMLGESIEAVLNGMRPDEILEYVMHGGNTPVRQHPGEKCCEHVLSHGSAQGPLYGCCQCGHQWVDPQRYAQSQAAQRAAGQLKEAAETCPHCGSRKFGIMPPDFETAKCDRCKRNFQMQDPPLPESEERERGCSWCPSPMPGSERYVLTARGAESVARKAGDEVKLCAPCATRALRRRHVVKAKPVQEASDDKTDRVLGLGKYARRLSPEEQRRQDAFMRDFQAGMHRPPAPPEARKSRSERPFRLVVQKTQLGKPGDVHEASPSRVARGRYYSYGKTAAAVRRAQERRPAPTVEYDVPCHVCGLPGPVYDGKVRAHGPGPNGSHLCSGSLQHVPERVGDASRDPA